MSALDRLQKMADREKVNAWLKSIGANREEAIEVLQNCKDNVEARAYFVARFEGWDYAKD